MNASKSLAGALALNRAAFGVNYLLRPGQARASWIGRAAKKPGTQVIVRSQGVRDVALGTGALRSPCAMTSLSCACGSPATPSATSPTSWRRGPLAPISPRVASVRWCR
jgi:hypothetical protein